MIVRGVDDTGKDLVIARDYLTRGLRERAAELVDLDLGPRSDREVARSMLAEIDQERFTGIDRRLFAAADAERVTSGHGAGAFEQSLRAGRLATLERMGLAEPLGGGRFRLASNLATTLIRMGERGDIVRTMQRAFTAARVTRAAADQAIYDPAAPEAAPLTGRVLARGLADEHRDHHYLIVDALDGRSHYISLGREAAEGIGEGTIVRIDHPLRAESRRVDRTVAAVAAANGGRYSVDAHRAFDPGASEAFAEAHVRRLEALRRTGHGGEREADGTWRIAGDHLERAAAFEAARAGRRDIALVAAARKRWSKPTPRLGSTRGSAMPRRARRARRGSAPSWRPPNGAAANGFSVKAWARRGTARSGCCQARSSSSAAANCCGSREACRTSSGCRLASSRRGSGSQASTAGASIW